MLSNTAYGRTTPTALFRAQSGRLLVILLDQKVMT
jgi:hypothetical protein